MATDKVAISSIQPVSLTTPTHDDLPQSYFRRIGTFGYSCLDIVAHNDYTYIAEGTRIRILSYLDPLNVSVVAELFNVRFFDQVLLSPDGTRLITLARAYRLADPYGEISIYDVSDPATPLLLSRTLTPLTEIYIHQNRLYGLYHGDDTQILQVYSLADDRFSYLGETEFNGYGKLFFDRNVLLAAPYADVNTHVPIFLYDISNDIPEFKHELTTIGGVALPIDGYLYVMNGQSYIDVWDIQDIEHPQIVNVLPTYLYPVTNDGNLVLARSSISWRGLVLHEMTPTGVRLIGETDYFTYMEKTIWSRDNELYLCHQGPQGNTPMLERITFASPFEVTSQGMYILPRQYTAIPINEQYVYLFGTTSPGIDIHHFEEPLVPGFVTTVLEEEFTWPPAREYQIVGEQLYVKRPNDIAVLDIREPLAPSLVATYPLEGEWILESVHNGYLYALRKNSNQLFLLRLSDHAGQQVTLPTAGQCTGLDTEGAIMVVLCDNIGVYDISVPKALTLISELDSSLDLLQPDLKLPYLFVTSETELAIFDLTDPTMPHYQISVNNPVQDGCPHLIEIREGYYLRQCYGGDADIVDLTIPTTPRQSKWENLGRAKAAIMGSTAIVANEQVNVWQLRPFLEQVMFLPLVESP